MDNTKKRKSIFKIVLSRIFIVVLLFNVIQALLNIYETVGVQRENEANIKRKIKTEIINTRDFWNSSFESIEKSFYYMQSKAMEKLIELHKTEDIGTVDLHEQLRKINLDSVYSDIYIIRKGKIVNTTFKKDLGLDLYSFGNEFKNFIFNVVITRQFTPEKFDLETSTKRLKCYSYQATEDRKYVIEIGSYSKIADETMLMFKNRLKKIVNENEDILDINFWTGNDDKQTGFIENDSNIEIDTLLSKVFESKRDMNITFTKDDRELSAEFIYLDIDKLGLQQQSAISIITNITDRNRPIYNIILKQLLYAFVFIMLVIFVIFLATRNLEKMLSDFMKKTNAIAAGELSERIEVTGNNEFTTLGEQFNSMVGELEKSYKELNEKNELIQENNELLKEQNHEIEQQRDALFRQTQAITDSIMYAQRIQNALLPPQEFLDEVLNEHFILFKPRDIVSGDFYWIKKIDPFTIIVTADCTGHGVPGAFMSMLGISFLNEIVTRTKFDDSGIILNRLRDKVKSALHQSGKMDEQKEGMDITLCIINKESLELQFSGAYNPVYIIRKDEMIIQQGDRQPIAIHIAEKNFSTHNIKLQKGDSIYTFSDGFIDQIGGKNMRRYMSKNFKELLLNIYKKPMADQKEILEDTFKDWRKDFEQVDDVLVIGLRV